jgi:hypothetical protein
MLGEIKSAATQLSSVSDTSSVLELHPTSYGLADVLFPAAPPAPQGARLVLGVVGMSESRDEDQEAIVSRGSENSATESSSSQPGSALSAVVRPSGHNRMHNLPPQKRRGNKAVRNRSLLTAAGWTMIDRIHECG